MADNNGLYVQLFSLHGLVRGESLQMGFDADTGGQIKYVVELARTLGARPEIRKVDLFTRLIEDRSVSEDYSNPLEQLDEKVRIVRIRCGGKRYMRKELLWPHLDEYVDKTIKFIKREGDIPDIVHGHYADAGYVADSIAGFFGLPLVFTGHSLGRNKLEKLLQDGMSQTDINRKFFMSQRLEAEEDILRDSDLIVTSTSQEIELQYGLYTNKALPQYRVIPPGVDIEKFTPYSEHIGHDHLHHPLVAHARASLHDSLNRFLTHPEKPLILAICRPEKRKNISGLIKAFGEDKTLQAIANLAIFAGIRKDISDKEENERNVLTEMLLLMDYYDLYGKMAIPKKHDFEYEVPELYRIAAEKKGVFVNVALTEPFGLTLIEASACGLPLVATNDGGPRDIIANCKNGVLVDPLDHKSITKAIRGIVTDDEVWKKYSLNGMVNVRTHYTWSAHCESYIKEITSLKKKARPASFTRAIAGLPVGKRLTKLDRLLITDIDNTLLGADNSALEELITFLNNRHEQIGFGIATGRTVDSALKILQQFNIPEPDVIISSVGAEIYYGADLAPDKGWGTHISTNWNRSKIESLLTKIPFLELQKDQQTQRPCKLSFNMPDEKDRLAKVNELLIREKCRANVIYSHQLYLDILPARASKGKAIRYLSYKWEIPLDNILVCGDSGNDEEMLRGDMPGVVVAGFSPELDKLRGMRKIFFAPRPCSGGILDGIRHYNFDNINPNQKGDKA